MLATEQGLAVRHGRLGARRLLTVHGVIDLHTAPRLQWAFARATVSREPLAVDLCDAEVTDSAGAALLVNAIRRLHGSRRDVVVVCAPGIVRTALERAGLARRLRMVDDVTALGPDPLGPAGALSPSAGRHRPSTPGRRATLLAEATLAMEVRHPEPDLGLPDVAREIATSNRQLQRVFSELAGSAFRDELTAVRMQHAAELLQTTDLRVWAVAERVGYRQAAQFAKAFRRHHGVSPSAFRQAAAG